MVNRRQFVKISGTYGLSVLVIGLGACNGPAIEESDNVRHLILLYTNDEHGWMDAYQNTGGAADLMYKWRTREQYDESDERFIILSGGDMWTGPALSTATRGEAMIDVMNAMGYRAAAIGNHDFDFDLENLQARADQANFPLLSANLSYRDDGSIPEFADPYVILDTNGVKVGILGLTTKETKIDTKPEAVDDLEFGAYEETIETYVPIMREEGADLILLISHLCAGDTAKLALFAAEHGIAVIGGGHCHKVVNEVANGTRIIESSYFMRGYTRLDLYFDTVEGEVILADAEFVPNKEGRADPVISEIIETWRDRVDSELWEVIGYTEGEIDRRTLVMDEIVPGSWLRAYPEADIALASRRYMQQDIGAGDITRGSILGVLATDNRILEVSLTGADLIHTIISRDPMLAGITEEGEEFILSDGSSVLVDEVYRVLIPHSLYSGGNYYEFHLFDENPVDIGMNWRDPVIAWIQSLTTSREKPLDQLLGSS